MQETSASYLTTLQVKERIDKSGPVMIIDVHSVQAFDFMQATGAYIEDRSNEISNEVAIQRQVGQ